MASLLDIQSKVVGTCMPLIALVMQCAPNLSLIQCPHVAHFVQDTTLSENPHVLLVMLSPSPQLPIGGCSVFHDLFLSHYMCSFNLLSCPLYAATVSPMFLLSTLSIHGNDLNVPGWVKWEEGISKATLL
ncbi:hypothetical protein EDC04DRAFT_2600340 [Pisolithus marmoratus]|nr:hypothetical protein EDC04DRAFT_2600340 [Pisolithus marmoratus]